MYKIMRSRFNEIISVTVEQQDGSVMCIPSDAANSDFQQYLAWVAEGNTAEEWVPEENGDI
jgi:hypothetical protein